MRQTLPSSATHGAQPRVRKTCPSASVTRSASPVLAPDAMVVPPSLDSTMNVHRPPGDAGPVVVYTPGSSSGTVASPTSYVPVPCTAEPVPAGVFVGSVVGDADTVSVAEAVGDAVYVSVSVGSSVTLPVPPGVLVGSTVSEAVALAETVEVAVVSVETPPPEGTLMGPPHAARLSADAQAARRRGSFRILSFYLRLVML